MANNYPVVLEVDQPSEPMSRWLWIVKLLLAIPHLVVLGFLGIAVCFVLLAAWVMIIFTGRYPRSLFDFVVGVNRWSTRVSLYLSLVTDRYPPFTMGEAADYPVRLRVEYPEQSSRLLALFRWILAIPHFVITGVLWDLLCVVVLIAGVLLLFTGRFNLDLFRLICGINRWSTRVNLYGQLVTDRYPPFSLD